jgi:TRAP-type transport system periplasmic protein
MTRIALIFVLAAALLAGCDSDNSDRAGGDRPVKPKVLVMANVNGELGELEAFDEAVKRVSGGHLRIKWLNEYGRDRGGNAEINLIRDVNAGKADLGWAGTRVFDELGDPAFNPLHAPLLVDSLELEERVLSDDLVAPMLESLDDLELQGIGVLPGPLRRPLGKHPLRAPDEWAGARIGSSGGDQIERALRSLGAEVRYDNPNVTEATEKLDGLETHIAAVPGNHYQHELPYLTDVILWPRPLVLFAGPGVGSEDLTVLREAAKDAIPDAIAMARSREREGLSESCRASLKVVSASAAQIDGLRAAFRPVYDRLEHDPAASQALARIQELSRDTAATEEPVRCPAASKPATRGTIPAGTYRSFITHADAREHGMSWAFVVEEDPDPKALKSKTKEYRLEFTDDGAFLVYDVWLDGTANIGWEGSYSIYRDRITVKGNEGTTITARVEVDGDRLRFTDVEPGPKTPEALTWGSKPFVKID